MTDLNPTSLGMSPANSMGPGPRALYSSDDAEPVGLSTEAWVKIALLAPLFVAVYWAVLRWLWDKTNPINGEANWGHAICIPFVGIYFLFINREDLLAEPVKPLLLGRFGAKHRWIPAVAMMALGGGIWAIGKATNTVDFDPDGLIGFGGMMVALYGVLVLLLDWGIGSLIFGLALFAYGIYPGKNQFLQGCAMIVTLFGLVLVLTGWRVMKYAWFPIIYLICGIPWPSLVYSYVASPLQTFAAKVAVVTLRFTGVNAYRTGTKINMGGITEPLRTLNVAEACAGMRSLMTFITVAMAVAFLSARPLWQKIVITVSAVPIAIFCNVMRVAGQGLLDHYVSRQLSESFAHQFVGLVMLVPAFFLILLVGWTLDHIFMEEVEETPEARAAQRMAMNQAASLVVEIPRKGRVAAIPARKPPVAPSAGVAPVAKTQASPPAKPQTGAPSTPQSGAPVKPQAPAPAKPQSGAPAARPANPLPRPGVIPPRPVNRPPQSSPPRPPQGPSEGT